MAALHGPATGNTLQRRRVAPHVTDLFAPMTLRRTTIANRIWTAPMCQYSCWDHDGIPNDWHLVHLGAFAQGGFGLVLTEASAVSPEGRISPRDAGIWNDEQVHAWRRITDFIHARGTLVGIQLAHAGRKASTYAPFPGPVTGSVPVDQGGWASVGPSAIAFPGYDAPAALDEVGLAKVVADFGAAARRSIDAGFDVIEVHAAHGYLLHEFLSPLSNQRTDEYGGSLDNRARLLLEVVDAVRDVFDGVLFVRISATDWIDGGWDIDQSIELAALLKDHDVDLVDTSTGGNHPTDIPLAPGYQVEFAERIRREAHIPTAAVGLLTEPEQADEVITTGAADAVLLGRVALREPHWPQRAAHMLGAEDAVVYQGQHLRGAWR